MITINDVKNYLYVPASVTMDDMAINGFIDVAYIYLRGAIDNFDELYEENEDFASQADFYATMYVAELYQQRNQYSSNNEPGFVVRSLMTQLQTYTLNKKAEGEE